MDIYLIRHGQTEWNREGRVQGWLDSPLTAKGVADAWKLSRYLAEETFDRWYTSPLPRAVETATILRATREVSLYRDDRLKEIFLDRWQGMNPEVLRREYPKEMYAYRQTPEVFAMEGAEDLHRLMERAHSFIDELPAVEKIIVISHGVTIRALKNALTDTPVKDFWQGPSISGASLTVARKEKDGWTFLVEGQTPGREGEKDAGQILIG